MEKLPPRDTAKLMDGRLKIKHFFLVDALARQGTVVGAAAELHTTQPATSRQLKELEDVLGVQLYTRHSQGVEPTIFGLAFIRYARAMILQLRQTSNHLQELKTAARGQVIIGSHLAGSNILLPRAIMASKQDRPLLNVIIEEGSPDLLLEKLDAGELDFILGRLTEPTNEKYVREPLYDESVKLFVRKGHPLAEQAKPVLSELGKYPWVLPSSGTDLRREIGAFLTRNNIPLPENQVQTTSFLTIRRLITQTDTIAALPWLIAQEDERLVPLKLELDSVVTHGVGITVAVGHPYNPAAAQMMSYLRSCAAEMLDQEFEP